MKTVGLVACSNPQKPAYKEQNETLIQFLQQNGKRVLISGCLYEEGSAYTYTGAERAAALMQLFRNPEVDEIYDISGGDMANEILDFLNLETIRNSTATFWGVQRSDHRDKRHLFPDGKEQRPVSNQKFGVRRRTGTAAAATFSVPLSNWFRDAG